MRLSKDKSSWKASGVIRKDKRNVKDEPKEAPQRSPKDTKRWCKGKKGAEHKLTWVKSTQYYSSSTWEKRCSKCGKKFDYWFETSWYKRPKPKEIP